MDIQKLQDQIDEVSVMLYQNREKEALKQFMPLFQELKTVSNALMETEGKADQQIGLYITNMYQNLNASYKYKDMLGMADCLQEYALLIVELYKVKIGQGIK